MPRAKEKTPSVTYMAIVEYETNGRVLATHTKFFKSRPLVGEEIPKSVSDWTVSILKEHGNRDVTVTICQVLWSIAN